MTRRCLVVTLVAGLALAAPSVAAATIDGPCTASIAGVDVKNQGTDPTSDAIPVDEDATIRVSMSAAKPIEQLTVSLEFAGRSWTVHDRPTTGTSWTSMIDVSDYADYGVGLYKVVGSSSGSGLECSGAALVDVQGNPLTTIAGLAGLGMTILGGLGLAMLAFGGPASIGRRIGGLVLGVVLAVGAGTLLQQYAILYPTQTVAIVFLVGGAVLGLLLPGLRRLISPA